MVVKRTGVMENGLLRTSATVRPACSLAQKKLLAVARLQVEPEKITNQVPPSD